MRFISALGATALLALTAFGQGCSSQAEEDEGDQGALTSGGSTEGKWVVDMDKVKSLFCGGEDCTSKVFFGVNAESTPGLPPQIGTVWDQTFSFDTDHNPVPADKELKAVKSGGQITGPKGKRLNIIPMLNNTDPSKQKYIIDQLQDGDVLAYFHAENTSAGELMERRISHVAMHYEYKLGEKLMVHHIDNPNNYGPRYNHKPSEQMPFHVFRYKPKNMTPEQSAKWGLSARNWGFITDDLSPFADFFSLTLRTTDDLAKFEKAAIQGKDIPEVYCSGLAYTNLNLGVNYPLNRAGLGADFSTFTGKKYAREEFNVSLSADALKAPDDLQPAAQKALVFQPYTPTDLATAWLENTFAAMPVPARKQIAMMPETQQSIAQGFSQLEFSDARKGGATPQRNTPAPAEVASPENVKLWAQAYGLGADQTAAFIADETHKVVGPQGPKTIKELVAAAHVEVGSKTPLQVIRELELRYIQNQFVPPRIWLDQADRADSPMVYIGTVISCDILAAADGSNANACEGGDQGTDQFSQGGADTSTYAHYAVPNGGERTHRRFDASPGPKAIGKNSNVTVRATASDISDVLFMLHTPEMYKEQDPALRDIGMMDYDNKCTELARNGKTCSPKRAIVLDPKTVGATAGTVEDQTYKFDLIGERGVCKIKDDNLMTCPVAEQGADGWRVVGNKDVSRDAHGLVAATMVDMKQKSAPSSTLQKPDRCAQCATGGAHYNGWTIQIRND